MKGPFGTADAAIKDFTKKFKDKTGNSWDDRDTFVPKTKKYTMIEMSLEDEDETDAPAQVTIKLADLEGGGVLRGLQTPPPLSNFQK